MPAPRDPSNWVSLVRKGHFVFESGHHGDTWLELDRWLGRPGQVRDAARELAERLRPFGADLVCGPLDGGAFLAQWVAAELDAGFTYSRRGSAGYELAEIEVAGRRAVVVDDAINAGSATLATVETLRRKDCTVLALGSVLVCAPIGPTVGESAGLAQVWLTEVAASLWEAESCPVCGQAE
jgi:orotate phosphoribosyltransferase